MNDRTRLLIALLALPALSYAADMYRWVDDSGRTHISDSVPERYRSKAQRIDSRKFEPSDAERKQALEIATRVRAQAAAPSPGAASQAASSAGNPTIIGTPSKGNRTVDTSALDCNAQWELYRRSQECFSPYRLQNGGINVEAFKHCDSVSNPNPSCGPPNWK